MSLKSEVENILREIENPDSSGIPTVFYDRPVHNKEKSEEEGRPVYDTKVYVRKHKDSLSIYDAPARDEDIKQNPKQYEIYLNSVKLRKSGTPLSALPGISPAMVTTCEACRIYTIEQLSQADDIVIMDIGDRTLRDKAVAFLNGETEKDIQIARLKEKLAELERVEENDDTKPGPRRRGRKPAVREADASGEQLKQGSKASAKLFKDDK